MYFAFLAISGPGFLDIFVLIVVFILILTVAYYVSVWVGKHGLNLQKNKNIKVLEVFRINQTKFIYLVEIGEKVMAIAVTKEHMEFLSEIPKDSLVLSEDGEVTPISFMEVLKKSKEELKLNDRLPFGKMNNKENKR